ncbi:MAG: efflux RND transporter periplasmic adaptor subunit [Bacteroidota bacterium]|nr:efflux RND transporter periplasmic adaptor subunit [Bacteroidota bacterium]
MIYRLLAISLLAFLLSACGGEGETGDHGHAHGADVSVTRWTDSLEVFVEYAPPAHAGSSTFIVHLTGTTNWSPVSEGVVVLYATGPDGTRTGAAAKEPLRAGVYSIPLRFRNEGRHELMLVYRGAHFTDSCRLPPVQVGAVAAEEGEEEEAALASHIAYSKEQQWSSDFASTPVQLRSLVSSISVTAEITALPGNLTEISAPVNGSIPAQEHATLPSPGSWIARGSRLATIAPDPGNVQGLAQIRAEYLDAKADHERVLRLHADGAVSDKRLENAKHRYDAARAGYALLRESDAWSSGDEDARLAIRAPVPGYLERVAFRPGQHVTAGQTLFVIVDPTRLMLLAHVPASHAAALDKLTDAWFRVEGFARSFRISELNGRLMARGSIVDPQTRTLRASFVFDNPGGVLAIGLFADAMLETGGEVEVPTVPREAVIDEADGVHAVYVQRGGETFERRDVRIGRRGERHVEILEGLQAGERVVVRGAQRVRLASMARSVPEHGHTH